MVSRRTVIAVVLLVVFTAFMVVPIGMSNVVDSEFGQWKIGIRAIGKDGSTTTLSCINTIGGQLLSVSRDDEVFESIEFYISAKATGEGYTQCEIDLTEVEFTPFILGACGFDAESGDVVTIDVGSSSFTEIFTYTLDAEDIDCGDLDYGSHTLSFESTGTAEYKGLPDGEIQMISSIPGAETTITLDEPDEDPPEDPPGECTWEYKYEYGSWSDNGCIGDGRMQQIRDRIVSKRYVCPGEPAPDWEYAWTDNQYQTIDDSSCDTSDPCNEAIEYGEWSNWVYVRCEGSMRYDSRIRTVITYICPGFIPKYSVEKEWRHYIDNRVCSIFQIIRVSPTFNVIGSGGQGSYYVDSEHYLGTRD